MFFGCFWNYNLIGFWYVPYGTPFGTKKTIKNNLHLRRLSSIIKLNLLQKVLLYLLMCMDLIQIYYELSYYLFYYLNI